MLRAAVMMADQIPYAKIEPIGIGAFTLQPGERAIVPVKWQSLSKRDFTCSTHPEAPEGLVVLPGSCAARGDSSCTINTCRTSSRLWQNSAYKSGIFLPSRR